MQTIAKLFLAVAGLFFAVGIIGNSPLMFFINPEVSFAELNDANEYAFLWAWRLGALWLLAEIAARVTSTRPRT